MSNVNRFGSVFLFFITVFVSNYGFADKLKIEKDSDITKATLLLPAVQSAREARSKPNNKAASGTISSGEGKDQQKGLSSTGCRGISACNELIASCAKKGGHIAMTSFDHSTGAPNAGYCRIYKPD